LIKRRIGATRVTVIPVISASHPYSGKWKRQSKLGKARGVILFDLYPAFVEFAPG
jgi:hypothetical protein